MVRKRRQSWRIAVLIISLLTPASATAAPRNSGPLGVVALQISPGASYRLERDGDELTLTIRDNKVNIRAQIERLRSPLVTGALVLSGGEQETIVRMQLAPGLEASGHMAGSPPRIMVELAKPAPRYSRKVEAEEVTVGRLLDAILQSKEPLKPPALPGGGILCVGSRVMYPVPLPEIPVKLSDWPPQREPLGSGPDAEFVSRALAKLDAGKATEALTDLRTFERRYSKSTLIRRVRYFIVEAMFASGPRGSASSSLQAIEQLRVVMRQDPSNPARARALYLAGRSYLELKYYHEASTFFHDLLDALPADSPGRVYALLALGWSDHHRFASEDSLQAFREAFPLVPDEQQGELVLAMASIMAQLGQYSQVLKLLDIIRPRWPDIYQSLVSQVLEAESLYRVDRFPEARALYEQIRSRMGASVPRVYEFRIGECLMMEKQFALARRFFLTPSTDTTSESRRWQEAMQELRLLQMDMEYDSSPSRQLINLEKLRKLRMESPFAPVSEEVLIEFIKFYTAQVNLPDALGMLRTFLTNHRENSQRRAVTELVWGRIRARLEDDFTHERYFEMLGLYELSYPTVVGEQMYAAEIAYKVARAYLGLGLYDQAYRAVTEAFFVEGSTRPLSDEALLLLAEIQRGQRRFTEAHRTLEFMRKRSPDAAMVSRATYEEALLLEAEGKVSPAVEAYRRFAALASDPVERTGALTRASGLLFNARGCRAALPILTEAATLAQSVSSREQRTSTADVYYRLGECHFTLGQYPAAVSALMTALSRHADHPLEKFARYALARSYVELNRSAEAEILYRALSAEKDNAPDDPWVQLAQEAVDQYGWQRSIAAFN